MDGRMQGGDFVHQFIIDGQTACSIDDDDAVSFIPGHTEGILCYRNRILYAVLGIDGDVYLGAEGLQLVDGGRAEGVTGGKQHLHTLLAADMVGKLGGEGGLTGTVQTGDEDDAGLSLYVDVGVLAAHEIGQFVVDDLDHHLLRLDRGEDVLSHRLGLDAVAEVLGHLVADVGVKQCPADVLQRLGNVYVGNLSFALQYLEGTLKSL